MHEPGQKHAEARMSCMLVQPPLFRSDFTRLSATLDAQHSQNVAQEAGLVLLFAEHSYAHDRVFLSVDSPLEKAFVSRGQLSKMYQVA